MLEIHLDYTSTKMCGHTASGDRPSQSLLDGLACGYTENAGINGVHNVLAVDLGSSMKQKLTEAGQLSV